MVKVSVVIASYCTGPGLDVLVASLDAQTLPTSEFEVVWVDDGSTDDTVERLQRLAAERPNYVVEQIPNSGWPGRPRNVGVRASRGEYVFFADHDDYLFPEALERVVEFALANDLDMVMPKEVVAGWARPGWQSWRRQLTHVDRFDQAMLQCITPHKLYRREWVLEQGIWFPEGRIRLEDFDYNAQAWTRTERIGVFADYPCYKWIIHDSNSHSSGYDFDVYWSSFATSMQPILALPASSDRRAQLLVRWYRSRILQRYGPGYRNYTDSFRDRFDAVVAGLLPSFPEELDALLTPADRARSVLVRAGDRQGLLALARADAAASLPCTVSAEWRDGSLHLVATGTVHDADGPLRVERRGDAVVRVLPAELAGSAADGLDVSGDLGRVVAELVVRARSTDVDWILPSHGSVWVEARDDGGLGLSWRIEGVFDPRTAAAGRPVDRDVWDVFYRLDGLGWTPTLWLPAPAEPVPPALVDGLPLTPYRTQADALAIDTADRVRTLVGTARPSLLDARATTDAGGAAAVSIDLPTVHVAGQTELPGTVTIDGRPHDARLVGDGTARLVVSTSRLSGYEIRARLGERPSAPLFSQELRSVRSGRRGGSGGVWNDLTPDVAAVLTPADREWLAARAAGDGTALKSLRQRKPLSLRFTHRSLTWEDDAFVLRLTAELADADGRAALFRRDGERLVRHRPDASPAGGDTGDMNGTGDSAQDLTRDVDALAPVVILRGRETKSEHLLPGTASCTLTGGPSGEELTLEVELEARLDAGSAAGTKALPRDVWDASVCLDALGWVEPTPVPFTGTGPGTALVSGVVVITYATKDDHLAVDTAERVRSVLDSTRADLDDAVHEVRDGRTEVTIPLPEMHVVGETELTGVMTGEGGDLPARVVGDEGGARLVIDGDPGDQGVRSQFTGRVSGVLFGGEASTPHESRIDAWIGRGRSRLVRAVHQRRRRG